VFVHDPHGVLPLRLNAQLVTAERLDADAADRLKALLERHHAHTDSKRAWALLASWPRTADEFRLVRPRAEVGRIEAEAEGTAGAETATEPEEGVAIP
jgi:glutamate synthase (NADPH) large chain